MKRFFALLAIAATVIGCGDSTFVVGSKQSDLIAEVVCPDNELSIELYRYSGADTTLLLSSPISLMVNGEEVLWDLVSSSTKSRKEKIAPTHGESRGAEISYTQMTCEVIVMRDEQQIEATLYVRIYADAMAYALELKDCPEGTLVQEVSWWVPADLQGDIFVSNAEARPIGPRKINEVIRPLRTPLVYKSGEEMMVIHESDVMNYPQMVITGREDGVALDIDMPAFIASGDVRMPYRVLMFGSTYQDLHDQKMIFATMNSKSSRGDYSWVKPGLAISERGGRGAAYEETTYALNTESLKRYIDFCEENSIRYFVVDEGWQKEGSATEPIEAIAMSEVMAYAKQKGVGIFLHYGAGAAKSAVADFEEVAPLYAQMGAAGVKYSASKGANEQGRSSEIVEVMEIAKRSKLMVVLQDEPMQFSGLERTYPNYMGREIYRTADGRGAIAPGDFVKMACIEMLAGHMGHGNGLFALEQMSDRTGQAHRSTVSAEAARYFISHTGSISLMHDAPEAYTQKDDLFQFITHLPNSWDETVYLDMDYDSHVAVAKRSGDSWFAAVAYGDTGALHTLDLSFLDPKTRYFATIYSDAVNTDQRTNREAYAIKSWAVTHRDQITLNVPDGGGFSVTFNKIVR